jgi:deoxyribodipyrimidine photolyase-related protein
MGHTALVLGDQLMRDHPALDGADRVLMVETLGGLERLRTHRRRVHLVLVAMRAFAAELRERGIEVVYRTGQPSLGAALQGFPPDQLVAARPNNATALRVLERRGVRVVESNQFLTTPPQFAAWAAEQHGGRLVMEPFYRRQRERFGLLMRDGGGPEGGRWNLDHLNRRPPTAETHTAPEPWRATEGPLDDEVRRDLDALGLDLWGEDAPRVWPATPEEARASLEHFCATRLAAFGPWQDAMVDGHPTLFHSLLSAPMNLGLVDPLEVARRVEEEFRAGRVALQSAEGYIRQVIGWREYMWGNYWLRRDEWPERNELDARMDLPAAFTGAPPARTGWRCLDSTVEKVWEDAYAHHIERLMVLGNIQLIAGVQPWQSVRWFQSAFIDGAEWVMAPNAAGMALHALGTEMLTKPYAGGGNYINRMSEHCGSCFYEPNVRHGERACPVTALYWDFMARNAERFDGNRRMKGPMVGLRRMPPEDLAALRERAARAREELRGTEG